MSRLFLFENVCLPRKFAQLICHSRENLCISILFSYPHGCITRWTTNLDTKQNNPHNPLHMFTLTQPLLISQCTLLPDLSSSSSQHLNPTHLLHRFRKLSKESRQRPLKELDDKSPRPGVGRQSCVRFEKSPTFQQKAEVAKIKCPETSWIHFY